MGGGFSSGWLRKGKSACTLQSLQFQKSLIKELTKRRRFHRFKKKVELRTGFPRYLNRIGTVPKQERSMDLDKFLELTKKLDSKKKGKKEELEKFKRFFERFHLLNRAYLDKETFEKAEESLSSMAEAIANTIKYLDVEITRLRNKRMKMPFENVELGEMQKIQNKNEMLIKEYLAQK
jgi:hypothetical protein